MLPLSKEESGLSVLSLESGQTHPAHPTSSHKVSVTGRDKPPVTFNPSSQCFPARQAREQGKIV